MFIRGSRSGKRASNGGHIENVTVRKFALGSRAWTERSEGRPWVSSEHSPALVITHIFGSTLGSFIRPLAFLRDPIRLDRIGEHRWWAKIVDEKNHNPIRLVRMVEKIESTIRSLQFP